MKAQLSHVHWGRVLLTGVLVDILIIILNLVLVFLIFLVWGQPYQSQIAQFAFQVGVGSASILAILWTVGGGVWVARKVESEAPLHGLLVGLVAALILILPGSVSNRRLDLVTLVTFVLMVAAGWLGGVLGSRGREKS
jgi:putative membrane protein (TIGR04086 family)